MKNNKFKNILLYFNNNNLFKNKTINRIYIIVFFQYFLIFYLVIIFSKYRSNDYSNNNNIFNILNKQKEKLISKNQKLDYLNNTFAIITIKCRTCALFSFYNQYLRCMNIFIKQGYIPIVDLLSFPNIFNNYNIDSLRKNPWELYFNQPYGYTMENVIKRAKKIKYYNCDYRLYEFPNKYNIIFNKVLMDFWHNMANNYIPVRNEILKEANNIIKKLFKGSNNILGVLVRGTDYISIKPKGHPKQPKIIEIFQDIKEMNKKNNYNWIFLATEDDIIDKFNFQ